MLRFQIAIKKKVFKRNKNNSFTCSLYFCSLIFFSAFLSSNSNRCTSFELSGSSANPWSSNPRLQPPTWSVWLEGYKTNVTFSSSGSTFYPARAIPRFRSTSLSCGLGRSFKITLFTFKGWREPSNCLHAYPPYYVLKKCGIVGCISYVSAIN